MRGHSGVLVNERADAFAKMLSGLTLPGRLYTYRKLLRFGTWSAYHPRKESGINVFCQPFISG